MSTVRTFRSSGFGSPGAGQRSLGIPTAAYPGRVATNSDLIVAVDRQQTTLLLPLAVADTTMTVLDASKIVGYNLLSIDDEIVKTTGPPGGNVVPISRGFDGTAAAAHSANAPVLGLIDAYHHNALVAEVEAIEAFLGPNGSNLPNPLVPATPTMLGGVKIGSGIDVQPDGTISTSWPYLVSSDYNFPAQTPGGTLIAGANTITLTPVPQGINSTDVNHSVLISGGTGTAEAALIIGGSATAGAPTGTLIIQCANAHSGAWTVTSATAGIREAINTLPASSGAILSAVTGGGTVIIPEGNYNIYAPVYLRSGVTIQGVGAGTELIQNTPNCSVITTALYNTTAWGVRDLTIRAGSSLLGWTGLDINAANSGIADNIAIFGSNQPDSVAVLIRGTKNTDGSYDYHNFSAQNLFSNLIITGVTRGIVFAATGLTPEGEAGSTQSSFYNIVMNIGNGPGIDFVSNTDTNYFYNTYIGYGGDATHPGIVFNSGNPSADTSVGGNHFFGLAVSATNAASVPLQFNYTSGNFIHSFSSVGATVPYTVTAHSTRCYVHGYSSGDGSNTLLYLPNNFAARTDDGAGGLHYLLRAAGGSLQLGETGLQVQIVGSANVVAPIAAQIGPNWIDGTTGANNAIQASTPAGGGVTLSIGTILTIRISQSLQAGPNTLAYAGGAAAPIKRHTNPASDIGTAYAVGGIITVTWGGSVWMDMSQ